MCYKFNIFLYYLFITVGRGKERNGDQIHTDGEQAGSDPSNPVLRISNSQRKTRS